MADQGDMYRRYFEYWENNERLEQLQARLPHFMGIVVMQLAQSFYHHISRNSFPPSGGDPEKMREAHKICLEATRHYMRPYAEVFGEEAWESMWSSIAEYLTGPTEVIIRHAEEEASR